MPCCCCPGQPEAKILDTCLVNRSLKAFMQICIHTLWLGRSKAPMFSMTSLLLLELLVPCRPRLVSMMAGQINSGSASCCANQLWLDLFKLFCCERSAMCCPGVKACEDLS